MSDRRELIVIPVVEHPQADDLSQAQREENEVFWEELINKASTLSGLMARVYLEGYTSNTTILKSMGEAWPLPQNELFEGGLMDSRSLLGALARNFDFVDLEHTESPETRELYNSYAEWHNRRFKNLLDAERDNQILTQAGYKKTAEPMAALNRLLGLGDQVHEGILEIRAREIARNVATTLQVGETGILVVQDVMPPKRFPNNITKRYLDKRLAAKAMDIRQRGMFG